MPIVYSFVKNLCCLIFYCQWMLYPSLLKVSQVFQDLFPKRSKYRYNIYSLYIKVVFACKKLAIKMKHVLGFFVNSSKNRFHSFSGFFSNIKKIEFKTSVKVLFSAFIDLQRSSCNSFSKQNSDWKSPLFSIVVKYTISALEK